MKIITIAAIVVILVVAASGAYFITKDLESASNDPSVNLPSTVSLNSYGVFSQAFNVSGPAKLTFILPELTKSSSPITSTGPYDFIIASSNNATAIENYKSEIQGNPGSFVSKAKSLSLFSTFELPGHTWYVTFFNPISLKSGEYKIIIINLSNTTEQLSFNFHMDIKYVQQTTGNSSLVASDGNELYYII